MIRIHWSYSFGNNMYHYIIARLLAEKFNLPLSYEDVSRWPRTKNPKENHAQVLTDPIEYLDIMGVKIDYYPEGSSTTTRLTNYNQLKNIKTNCEYVLNRKDAWNFFNREDMKNNFYKAKQWFPKIDNINKDDLVVHARLGKDWYRKNRGPEFKKIKEMLDTIEFDRIFICTDSPNDDYISNFKTIGKECIIKSTKTRECDPKTGFFLNEVGSKLIVDDFNFIRSFDKILLTSPTSTFSFLSAALSNASSVKFDIDEAKNNHWFLHELFQ